MRKQIRQFEIWAQEHSPGSSLDFLQKVYQVAQASQCLAHALEGPACVGRAQQYQVTLEAYGPPGNPMTMQVGQAHLVYPVVLSIACIGTLNMAYIVHRMTSMHHAFQMQEAQGHCQDCCLGTEALHAASVVMRDFRSPNMLTRNGAKGKYVVVDLEFAGPNKHSWTLDWLQDWDDHTLNQVTPHMASCNAMYWLQKVFQYVNSLGTSAMCACWCLNASPCIPVHMEHCDFAGGTV